VGYFINAVVVKTKRATGNDFTAVVSMKHTSGFAVIV
jgi:hypothetical protein